MNVKVLLRSCNFLTLYFQECSAYFNTIKEHTDLNAWRILKIGHAKVETFVIALK